MSKKLNDGGTSGADPTQSPEALAAASAAEAERVRQEQEAAANAEAEQKAKAAKDAEDAARVAAEVGLIKMFKEGTTLEVHPTCASAHEAAGWKVSP